MGFLSLYTPQYIDIQVSKMQSRLYGKQSTVEITTKPISITQFMKQFDKRNIRVN